MKRILILFLLVVVRHIAIATPIEGVVLDENKQPLEFATVKAFADTVFVNAAMTDIDGKFIIKNSNITQIQIDFLGYKQKRINLFVDTKHPLIVEMTPDSKTLGEVIVKASYIQRHADRILVNIAGNPLAQGKDVKELLKTAPGVWVTDDALSIFGQSGTTVYINDRKVNMSGKQLMQYLQTMPSSLIARIEVIPYAGAEYSADSPGGIIKIVTRKRNDDGILGNVGTSFTLGKKKLWVNPNFNFSFHRNRLTFNFSGSVNGSSYDKSKTTEDSYNILTGSTITGVSKYRTKSLQVNALAGLFYQVNNRNTIGLEFEFAPNYNKSTTGSQSLLTGENVEIWSIGKYLRCDKNYNSSIRFSYSYMIDSLGSSLKLISNYNHQKMNGDEDNKMIFIETDSTYKTINESRYHILTTELKFEKYFTRDLWINVGGKHTMNDIANSSLHSYIKENHWVDATTYNYKGDYQENILASWITASYKFDRWRAKAGLRYEYFRLGQGEFSEDYSDIFPNANISYSLNERGDYSVSLGYYRNIARPSFWALNPTIRQISDYSYTVGNPQLTPSYTNSLSLDFILANRFTIACGYSESKDVIHQMFVESPEFPERMYFTWGNDGTAKNLFIHADGNTAITSNWSIYANATYVWNFQKGNSEGSTFNSSYLQLLASTTYSFPKQLNVTANCFYMSKMRTGNLHVYPSVRLSASVSKCFGDRWNLFLNVDNLLQQKSKVRAFSSNYDRLRSTKSYATITLNVSYAFSSGKQFRKPRMEYNIDGSRFSQQ